MRTSGEPIAICFGKLPIAGDFLRGDGPAPEFLELDEWIEKGLYESQQRGEADWQARFDALAPVKFLWSADKGPVIAGWLQTSHDAVGRRYPFLIAARIPDARTRDFAAVPLALTDFFTAAKELLDTAFDGHDVVGAIDAVQRLALHCDLPSTRIAMDAHLGRLATADAWAGHQDAPELLLHDLAMSCEQATTPNYSLRWPSRGGDSEASFWLASMATFGCPRPRLITWRERTPDTPGRICALLGALQPRLFHGLLFADQEDDDAYDLGRSTGADSRMQQAQDRFAAIVSCPDQAGALDALRKVGRR